MSDILTIISLAMNIVLLEKLSENSQLSRTLLKQHVEAGFNTVHDEASGESIDLNKFLMPNSNTSYLMRVIGDSMINAGIHAGDTVIVDRSKAPANNDIVVATINGEFTIKRLILKRNKPPTLKAENPYYVNTISSEDLNIWGVVTWIISKAA